MSPRFLERRICCLLRWGELGESRLRRQDLSFGQVTFKCLLASEGGVTKTSRGASLWFKGHIKAREAGGIGVEEAFEAWRLGEISMEVSVGRGEWPKD